MNARGARTSWLRCLAITVVIGTTVSWLPAGIGALGRKGGTALRGDPGDVTILAGGQVEVTVLGTGSPVTFTHVIDPNSPPSQRAFSAIRDSLVAQVDAHASFSATAGDDPGDPNANGFSALLQAGGEVSRLGICENNPNLDDLAVSFPAGTDYATLNKVTVVNGDGDYRLVADPLVGPTYDETFNTTVPPNNTAAGLNNSITAGLINAGYVVYPQDPNGPDPSIQITKKGSRLVAVRVFSTDTGVVRFCVNLQVAPPPATGLPGGTGTIPTAGQTGMLILILLVTSTAIWILKR